jgi:hypothetical protein
MNATNLTPFKVDNTYAMNFSALSLNFMPQASPLRESSHIRFFAKARRPSAALASLALLAVAGFGVESAMASTPQSVNVIRFADDQTLLLGDSKSAKIYAYKIPLKNNAKAQSAYNLTNVDSLLARFAHTSERNLLVRNMAISPKSKEAFVAFDVKTAKGYQSYVAAVNQAGEVHGLDLAKLPHTEVALDDAPTDPRLFWDKSPMRSFTITDLLLHDGKVYVSGLSNAEFSSALRVFDFPFQAGKATSASVEIFHAVHNQNETRAPIQTMQITNLNGEDYIVAAYTCTPLVLIGPSSFSVESNIHNG